MYTTTDFIARAYYSLELKDHICKEHLQNGLSISGCVKKYHLSSHSLVHDWLRDLGYIPGVKRRIRTTYIGIEKFEPVADNRKKNKQPLTADQQQIELLKRQLEDAKLLAEGYRRMIEIAESELKIPIRKKRNTK